MKKSPIKRISPEQRKELRLRAKLKKELLEEQIEEKGYTWCVACGQTKSVAEIQLGHIIKVQVGGTSRENCKLWCQGCHIKISGH